MAEPRRTPEQIAQSLERAKHVKAQQVLNEQRKNLKYAKWALLAIAVLELTVSVMLFAVFHWPLYYCAIDGVFGLVFLGLYFLSKEHPKIAFNIGLFIYGGAQLILVLLDNKNMFNGLLIKLIIFSTLFGGLHALKRIPPSLMKKKSDELLDEEENTKGLV
ncbi:MAG: hypothetical protein IPM77_00795 [Crocinitomicaceae bacterium]|nr:hypothetical protein [Crocinitomicaceae bacterium]